MNFRTLYPGFNANPFLPFVLQGSSPGGTPFIFDDTKVLSKCMSLARTNISNCFWAPLLDGLGWTILRTRFTHFDSFTNQAMVGTRTSWTLREFKVATVIAGWQSKVCWVGYLCPVSLSHSLSPHGAFESGRWNCLVVWMVLFPPYFWPFKDIFSVLTQTSVPSTQLSIYNIYSTWEQQKTAPTELYAYH